MKYQNWIPEPGMTIFGFADKKFKNNNNNADRPTLDFFDMQASTFTLVRSPEVS